MRRIEVHPGVVRYEKERNDLVQEAVIVMAQQAAAVLEDDEAAREELFRLEQEGRALILEPENTAGFSRVERDVEKIRALYREGYDAAMAKREELGAFLKNT